jgi:solute carrier family 26 (sodium-independent sulfate anion transporter), member 11
MTNSKYFHVLAQKVFGIDPHNRHEEILHQYNEPVTRVVPNAYHEQDPTVAEWFGTLVPTKKGISTYVHDIFPSAQWVSRYCWRWLLGDCIAGLTIGFVIVPQAMAYALLAQLSPEYVSYARPSRFMLIVTDLDCIPPSQVLSHIGSSARPKILSSGPPLWDHFSSVPL